jgi:hypothetical protein
MTSERKSAASRANGAKSRGPKTAETKLKSSQNSLRHGFASRKTILLSCSPAKVPRSSRRWSTNIIPTISPAIPSKRTSSAK